MPPNKAGSSVLCVASMTMGPEDVECALVYMGGCLLKENGQLAKGGEVEQLAVPQSLSEPVSYS